MSPSAKTLLQRRHELVKHRDYLKNMRAPYLYGRNEHGELMNMPAELDIRWSTVGQELNELCIETQHILLKLLDKLPRCEECQKASTYQLPNGPFFCDLHAQEHPTAVEVAWCAELRELGVDKEP